MSGGFQIKRLITWTSRTHHLPHGVARQDHPRLMDRIHQTSHQEQEMERVTTFAAPALKR